MISALMLMWALGLDAGIPRVGANDTGARAATVRPEDTDLVENLELLENMDSSSDFDLLRELSIER